MFVFNKKFYVWGKGVCTTTGELITIVKQEFFCLNRGANKINFNSHFNTLEYRALLYFSHLLTCIEKPIKL